MTKNSFVVDADLRPLGTTYPRRAKHLVKKGRAQWVDGNTIMMKPTEPSIEAEDTDHMDEHITVSAGENVGAVPSPQEGATPWTDYFKTVTDELIHDKELVMLAIQSISRTAFPDNNLDTPSQSISNIMSAHYKCKAELLKTLMEFVDKRGLR